MASLPHPVVEARARFWNAQRMSAGKAAGTPTNRKSRCRQLGGGGACRFWTGSPRQMSYCARLCAPRRSWPRGPRETPVDSAANDQSIRVGQTPPKSAQIDVARSTAIDSGKAGEDFRGSRRSRRNAGLTGLRLASGPEIGSDDRFDCDAGAMRQDGERPRRGATRVRAPGRARFELDDEVEVDRDWSSSTRPPRRPDAENPLGWAAFRHGSR